MKKKTKIKKVAKKDLKKVKGGRNLDQLGKRDNIKGDAFFRIDVSQK